jgi:hypothetical protein
MCKECETLECTENVGEGLGVSLLLKHLGNYSKIQTLSLVHSELFSTFTRFICISEDCASKFLSTLISLLIKQEPSDGLCLKFYN